MPDKINSRYSTWKMFSCILIILGMLLQSCNDHARKNGGREAEAGRLIIFHAGSLSVPMKEISEAFREEHPDMDIQLEAAGSVACARKITDLKKECDIMASADYKVIEKFLIPGYTKWHIPFATNEMVIAYTNDSRKASRIDSSNWYHILSEEEIIFGRSDPDQDPCGYRTVLTIRLSKLYYRENDIFERLLVKNRNFIRPKEVDLIALLQTGAIDYAFIYRSVAMQHHLNYIVLPDAINLKNPEYSDVYQSASVEIYGSTPDERITLRGEPMIYGITALDKAPHPGNALLFLSFFLSEKGMNIMEKNGQASIIPSENPYFEELPDELKKFSIK